MRWEWRRGERGDVKGGEGRAGWKGREGREGRWEGSGERYMIWEGRRGGAGGERYEIGRVAEGAGREGRQWRKRDGGKIAVLEFRFLLPFVTIICIVLIDLQPC